MMQWRYSLAALAGIGLLPGCQQRQEPEDETVGAATEAAPTKPTLPVAEPPLDREAMLLATLRAASGAALGIPAGESQRALEGKRFSLRLRFGCAGDGGRDRARGWTFDERRRKLSLRVEPEIEGANPLLTAVGEMNFEAVEGFLVRRPWMLAAGCPAPVAVAPDAASSQAPGSSEPAAGTAPPSAVPQIAIVQFFSETDARTHRRDSRAYSATKVLAEGAVPSPAGYDLVIAGRLRRSPGGSVIACVNRSVEAPPDCIVSVVFDSVAIEEPTSGEKLAEWTGA